jgi:TusA-related sulfurtransferase
LTKKLDLRGSFCPYPVVETIELIDSCDKGVNIEVLVDDPLAIKAIPEELEDDNLTKFEIVKENRFWKILIQK